MVSIPGLAFEAFADPTRREILMVLAESESTVSQLAEKVTHVGRTTISGHLRVLRTAGLITERREGRYRHYSVNQASADHVVNFFQSVYGSMFEEVVVDQKRPQTEQRGTAPRRTA